MSKLLLKLSGEALGGAAGFGLEPDILERAAIEIKNLLAQGGQLASVLGGGNLFRGEALEGVGALRLRKDPPAGDRRASFNLAAEAGGATRSDEPQGGELLA